MLGMSAYLALGESEAEVEIASSMGANTSEQPRGPTHGSSLGNYGIKSLKLTFVKARWEMRTGRVVQMCDSAHVIAVKHDLFSR